MTTSKLPMPVRKAVFPVAGLGTRFLPATKVMPKEMLTINDRPLIQHVVEEAADAGVEEFIFITGRGKQMLVQHFDCCPELEQILEERGKTTQLERVQSSNMPEGKLSTTRQAQALGLGHAVWCARKLVGNEPFAVILPDDVIRHDKGCLTQMMDLYRKKGGNIVAVKEVEREDTKNYGILDIESDDGKVVSIKGLVEKPKPAEAPSTLSIIGRYILQPEVFDHLSKMQRGAGNEIQITDSMAQLIGTQPFHGLKFEGEHFDCGSRLGFIAANLAYGLHDDEIGAKVADMLNMITSTFSPTKKSQNS